MTKKELVELIKENFADEDKRIDISGLDFEDYDVNISALKTKGSLCQNFQEVGEDLIQSSQKVGGNLSQYFQKVKGSIWQHYQEAEEVIN